MTKISIKQHWLDDVRRIHSPNYDDRPNENDISLIVIHCISLPPGEFSNDYIDHLFCNQLNPEAHCYFETIHQLKVSAHILIDRNGVGTQFVPFNKRAWHAGQSEYKGRKQCNDFSIGIELEGTESIAYTDAQYSKLALLINSLVKQYPGLSKQEIAGHDQIAPGRKTDPGSSFDWGRLESLLSDQPR